MWEVPPKEASEKKSLRAEDVVRLLFGGRVNGCWSRTATTAATTQDGIGCGFATGERPAIGEEG